MKRILTLGSLALCLTASPMVPLKAAHAAPSEAEKAKAVEAIKSAMVENYLLWEIAVKGSDADRIISFEAPEFTHELKNGEVHTKGIADAELRALTKRIRKVHSARVYVKRVNIEPHRVVVWAERELEADIHTLSANNESQIKRLSFSGTTHDTWVKYRDNWVLKRIKDVTTKTTIDGQPVPN